VSKDFYANKPSWFPEYALAIATYVIQADRVLKEQSSFITRPSDFAEHLDSCALVSVSALDEEVDVAYYYGDFDNTSPYAMCIVSVKATCACKEYVEASASKEGTLAEIIDSIYV
jgi:hypothetical protein